MNIGSVGVGRFVTWGYDDVLATQAFILWRITDSAVVRVKAVASDITVYRAAENDAGVVAFCGSNGSSDFAARLNADLTYTPFTAPNPYLMWVSGDGQEIVIQTHEWNALNDADDTHLYGYSLTGEALWDFVINTSTNISTGMRPSGYVVGVPRAGRVVWANTTITQYTEAVASTFTEIGGYPGSWSVSGTMPGLFPYPVTNQTVIFNLSWSGRTEYGYNPSCPYPNYETGAQAAIINGSVAVANLNAAGWAPDLFYVKSWVYQDVSITGAGGSFYYELVIDPFFGPDFGNWWSAHQFYSYGYFGGGSLQVTYDLRAAWGGNRYELRNGSGAVLDTLEIPVDFSNQSQWIGIGSDSIAGFPVVEGGGE
jgi:hypothetical protein